jgi:hypothetical protein
MHDIHTVAERFLKDLERGVAHFYAPADNPDVEPVGETLSSDRVMVMRDQSPQYLAGVKNLGVPVFTHDMRLAASYDSASLKLIDVLRALKFHKIQVETMPACWFSNHQIG